MIPKPRDIHLISIIQIGICINIVRKRKRFSKWNKVSECSSSFQ